MSPSSWLVMLLVTMNAVAAGAFAFDKYQAQHSGWRVRRAYLVALLFLAPFLPVTVMVALQHKTRKRLFMASAVVAGSFHLVMLVYVVTVINSPMHLVLYIVAAGSLWLGALALQARRGCACEAGANHARDAGPALTLGRA